MPINVNDPEYVSAEKDYFDADTKEQKLTALKKMISHAPKHKGGENLRQQLTTRRKKLEQEIVKAKKSGKSRGGRESIKKEEMQAAIIGLTNSGKSSLLKLLTNANPKISETDFTTTYPQIGMLNYQNSNIQLIEIPAIDSEYFDKGVSNTADTLLVLIDDLKQIDKINSLLPKASKGKKIIVFNKIDLLSENQIRKISATLQSKKHNFVLISAVLPNRDSLEELKEKLFMSFGKIRVYTKEPGKEKSPKPIILNPGATIKDVAEKILHGFSKQVREIKIWGPSSKFPNQKVGLKHKLKDLDIVEFKTK